MQHKLIRMIRPLFNQVILATHSVEIIEASAPEDILVIERDAPESRFAGTQPAVQRLIDRLGGRYNINLARLGRAKKFIAVEGKDLQILNQFHCLLYPDRDPLTNVPNMPIGGWGGWQHAVSSPVVLHNAIGQELKVYCFLDSDYHLPEQIEERYVDAKAKNVELHVWRRKEIENYLLDPSVLHRLISARSRKGVQAPTVAEVENKVGEIVDTFYATVVKGFGPKSPSVSHSGHSLCLENFDLTKSRLRFGAC
ncbi:MAG: hypothetical protein HY261_01975 [Chloroflexi bacterium]|nr:hypothetical protein [Chloroflexota bacterium]